MAAVISGNGLGLFNSSAGQVGLGLGGNSRLGQGQDHQYVNVATGNLLLQTQDDQVLFRGMQVGFNRTYNSRGQVAQVGADAWTTGFERWVELASGSLNVAGSVMRRHTGDGAYQDFQFVAPGQYASVAGDGAHDSLSWDAGTATWLYVEGSTRQEEQYADHANATLKGRLTRLRDLRTDPVAPLSWDVTYDANGRVAKVASVSTGSNSSLAFDYDVGGRLSRVTSSVGATVIGRTWYAYDSAGRLSSVTVDLTPGAVAPGTTNPDHDEWTATEGSNDGYLFKTTYTYTDATGTLIAKIEQSDGSIVSYTYDAQNRVKTVTRGDSDADDSDGLGQTLSFSYDSATATTLTDSAGRSWTYLFDANGQLLEVRDPAVDGLRDSTFYSYDSAGNVTQMRQQRGGTVLEQADYAYDSAGNVVWQWQRTGSDATSRAVQRTYTGNNQLASETVFTGLDADGAAGGAAPSGGLTTRYLYDAQDRLRYSVGADGVVRELEYHASGLGVGQLSRSRLYLGEAYAGEFSVAALGTWATPARKAGSILTDYKYYSFPGHGERTYASVDANGEGVLSDADVLQTYRYDERGRIILKGHTSAENSFQTIYGYDGLGRATWEVVRANMVGSQKRTWVYTDSQRGVFYVTEGGKLGDGNQGNDLVRFEYRNAAGQVVYISNNSGGNNVAALRESRNYYDSTGRLRASEDSSGARSYLFYDEEGHLSAEVDETGAVVEYVRDELGRVRQTKAYATRVDTSAWLVDARVVATSLAAIRPAATAQDRVSTDVYDAAGLLLTHTDGEGAITRYNYDGAGRLLQTRITDAAGTAATARTTRYFYDAQGRELGRLDAEGYLVEHNYDLAGRRVRTVAYANATAAAQREGGGLADLRPAGHGDDQVSRWFYDGRGNIVATLDAEGYLTEFVHDAHRLQVATKAYALKLGGLTGNESLASLRGQAAAGAVRETRRSYDQLGRLLTEQNAEGTVTRYSYDAQGNLIRTETAADTSEVREGLRRYNVFGELIGELDGEGAALATPGMSESQLDALYAQHGVRHSYNSLGQRIESIDAAGNKTWYFYDAGGRQTFLVRGVADAAGVPNAQGEVVETRYNAFGEASDSIAYSGRITVATAGSRDSVAGAIATLSYVASVDSKRSYTYTRRGQLALFSDAQYKHVQYSYNAFGDRTQEEVLSTGAMSTTQIDYDRRGLATQRREGVGEPVARSRGWTYDAFGRVIRATDAHGVPVTYTYDRLGRQLSVGQTVLGRVQTTATAYDAYGRVLSLTDALGRATTTVYDDLNRKITTTTPEGVTVATSFNRHGQQVNVATPLPGGGIANTVYVYDRDGLLTSTTDALGRAETSEYDARGLLTATVDRSGRRVELRYDAAGRMLQRIEDPAGLALTTRFRYDGQGRKIEVTDASGRRSAYAYDGEGRLIELVLDPAGLNLRTTYSYDPLGRQVRVVEGAGTSAARTVQYVYDALGRRIAERIDPNGLNLQTSYVYDGNDNLIRRTDATGQVTRYLYDEAGQLIYTIDPLGVMVRLWHDVAGRVVATRTFIDGTDTAQLSDTTTVAQLDARLSWNQYDPNEFRILDKDGRLRLTVSVLGEVQEYGYDAGGRVASIRRYAKAVSTENWLASGLLGRMYDGSAEVAELGLDAVRNDAADQITYQVYTVLGELRTTVDNAGTVVSYVYDAAGRQVVHKRYSNKAQLNPTIRGKLAAGTASPQDVIDVTPVDNATDLVTYTSYDGAGRARYALNGAGGVTETLYDAAGRVVGTRAYATAITIDATLKAQLIAGDPAATGVVRDRLAAVASDARDLRSYQVYDAAGRIAATVDGAGYVSTRSYDAAGRPVLERRQAQAAAIDAALWAKLAAGTASAGELAAVAPQSASADAIVRHIYDAAGRERYTLVQNSASTYLVSERRYDGAGRVIAQYQYSVPVAIGPVATPAQVGAALNAAGAYATADRYRSTQYVFDAAGRVRFTVDDMGAVNEQRYDGAGRIVESRRYGGYISIATPMNEAAVSAAVAGIADVRKTTTAYDAMGRARTVTDALNQQEQYTYDGLGQVTAYRNKNGHTWTYGYDLAGRRTSETSPEVGYAAVDSWGNQSYANRRLVTRTEYDALGNVIKRLEDADGPSPRITRYEYDNRGHQVRTVFPDAGKIDPATGQLVASGTQPTLEVSYDALGRAVMQKDVRGYYSHKVYDGLGRLAFEIDQEGHVTSYGYDGFGQQTQLRRHAQRLNAAALPGWSESQPLSLAQAQAGAVASADDRTITTRYDQRGLAVQIEQSQVTYYTAAGSAATGAPTVQVVYNAYGQKVKESVLLEGVAGQPGARWADSYTYYDLVGRATLSVDAEGYVTRTRYNATGEALERIEYAKAIWNGALDTASAPALPPSGDAVSGYDRVTRWSYDALGRKASETQVRHFQRSDGSASLRDVTSQFRYDGEDRLTQLIDDTGTTTTEYDSLGRVSAITEPARRVVSDQTVAWIAGGADRELGSDWIYATASPHTRMGYDAFGNVVYTRRYVNGRAADGSFTDHAKDQIEYIRYDWQGRSVAVTVGNGDTRYREYDAADHVVHDWYNLSATEASRDVRVHGWYSYDKTGRQTGIGQTRDLIQGGGSSGVDRSEAVAYNAFGEIVQKAYGGLQGSLNYAYDAAGRLVSSNESVVVKQFGYDLAGHQVRESHLVYTGGDQRVEAVTWNTVDRLGRVLSTRHPSHTDDPAATTTSQQRVDRWGNVVERIDARGYQTLYRYNELNQVTRDERPLVENVTESGVRTWLRPVNEWFYDSLGRLVGTRDANGNTRTNEYDATGRLIKSKDALGQATLHGYDALGQERLMQDAQGYLTYKDYDALGRLTETGDYLVDGSGGRARTRLQSYWLNQNGDRLMVFDAAGAGVRYEYDSQHRLIRSQTAMGVLTRYAYDARGNKILESYTGSGATVQDHDGETVRLDESTWDYDAYGRLIDHNNLSGRDFDYDYDPVTGQLKTEVQRGGNVANAGTIGRGHVYYANGLLKAVFENSNDPTFYFQYDAAGNRILEDVNTVDGGGRWVRIRTHTWYDSNNRIQRVIQDDLAAGKRSFDLRYSYDAAGNRRNVSAMGAYGPDAGAIPSTNTVPVAVQTPASRAVHKGGTTEFSLVFNDVFRDAEQDALNLQITLGDGSPLPAWLSTWRDTSTGLIRFVARPPADAPDMDLSIRLVASEAANGAHAAATAFTVYVRNNVGPQLISTEADTIRVKVGQDWSRTLTATDYFYDADVGDQLRLSVDNAASLPAWLTLDPSTMQLRVSASAPAGSFAVFLRATDPSGAAVVKTIHVVVAANSAPTGPSPLPNQSAVINYDFSWSSPLSQVFTDVDGDRLTVTASGLPAWLSFQHVPDASRPELRLSGRPGGDITPGTVFTVTLTATDTSGASKSTTIAIAVRQGNQAPNRPANFAMRAGVVGQWYSFQLPAFVDPEGDALSHQLTGLPSGFSFDPQTRTVTGVPSQEGPISLVYTATDAYGARESLYFNFYCFVNDPPVPSSIPNQSAGVGSAYAYQIPEFTDPDYNGVTYSATGLPPGLSMSSTGLISGAPSTGGSYTVTVTGDDGYGGTASTSFVLTVNALPPPNQAPVRNHTPQNVYMQISESSGVGETAYWPWDAFVDPDGNPLSYQLINSPAWVYYSYSGSSAGGHQFGLYPPGQTKSYTITVRATDNHGAYVDMSFQVYVQYQPGGGEVPYSQPGSPEMASMSFDGGSQSEQVEGPSDQLYVDGSGQPTTASATASSTAAPVDVRDYWFTYDAENRIRINNGRLVNNAIVLTAEGGDSYLLGYDAVGNAVSRTFYRGSELKVQYSGYDLRGNRTVEYHEQLANNGSYFGIDRTFSYDANRRLTGTRRYFAAGSSWTRTSRPGEAYEEYETYDFSGWLSEVENYSYDADGRLIYQQTYTRKDNYEDWVPQASQNNADNRQTYDTSVLDTLKSRVEYVDAAGNSTYDSTGKATGFRTYAPGYMHTYTTTYEGWESYKEKTVSGVSTNSNYKPTTNTLSYDLVGRLTAQQESTRLKSGAIDDRIRYYAYNGDGQVQTRREGTLSNGQFVQNGTIKPNYLYAYGGGQQLAQIMEGSRIVSLNGTGLYEAGGNKVVALAGENLRQLAQRIYGNDQLWYVLAQANGLGDPDQEIGGGLQLEAPQVDVSRNDANTFKPYNPNEAIGSTTPSLPYIPPPPSTHCSAFATVMRVMMTVAAVYLGPGYYSAAVAMMGEGVAQTVEIKEGLRSGYNAGSIAVAGISAYTAGYTPTSNAMVNGAIAAGGNYLASYAVNKAFGIEDHFSWRDIAVRTVSASITAGVLGGERAPGGLERPLQQAVSKAGESFQWVEAVKQSLGVFGGYVVARGIEYGVTKAITGDASWNWRDVASGGVQAMIVAGFGSLAARDKEGRLARAEAHGSRINASLERASLLELGTDLAVSDTARMAELDARLLMDTAAREREVAGLAVLSAESGMRIDRRFDRSVAATEARLQAEARAASRAAMEQRRAAAMGGPSAMEQRRAAAMGGPSWRNAYGMASSNSVGSFRMQGVNGTSAQRVVSRGTLAPVENAYTPYKGWWLDKHAAFTAMIDEPGDWQQKVGGVAGAILTSIPTLADAVIKGLYDAPNNASLAGQKWAQAGFLEGHDSAVGYLEGTQYFITGFLGIGDVVTLGSSGAIGSKMPASTLVAAKRADNVANAEASALPRLNLADDFSATTYRSGTREYLLHDPSPDGFAHGFLARVDVDGQMTFSVRASGNRAELGSGADMFDSFMLRAKNDGVGINSIKGEWHVGTDSVNAAQYLDAVRAGKSPQQAALSTWTGRTATRYGYTDVYVPEIQLGVIRPVFTKPAVKP